MKTLSITLIVAGGLLYCSIGKANITYLNYADDGDGALVCNSTNWEGSASSLSADITGDLYWGPGHVNGSIQTDGSDPTLTLANAINNDTSFAWTSYEVDIWMSVPFTISSYTVSGPAGWGVDSVVGPTGPQTVYQDGNPIPNQYIGSLYFSGTPAVAIGGELDFSYAITFTGSATFTQQLIPVPEPGMFGFLTAGALLLGGLMVMRQRRNRVS